MKTSLRAGFALGLGVALWTFVMGFTGWYKHPVLLNLFWVVIPMEIGILLWSLRRTAGTSSYGQQIGHGLLLCAAASVLIFAGSILFTSVVYPNYFKELEALGRVQLAQAGKSPAEIEAFLKAQAPLQNSVANALMGVVGTLVTGLVVSLVAAVWLRKKG